MFYISHFLEMCTPLEDQLCYHSSALENTVNELSDLAVLKRPDTAISLCTETVQTESVCSP